MPEWPMNDDQFIMAASSRRSLTDEQRTEIRKKRQRKVGLPSSHEVKCLWRPHTHCAVLEDGSTPPDAKTTLKPGRARQARTGVL